MPSIRLRGCSPEPLSGYLKGLALLRLVAEQADDAAHGSWDGASFRLESKFNEDALVDFFVCRYAPSPIVAPWNGGSGFYPGDKRDGIDAIVASNDPRFSKYRDAVKAIWAFPELPKTDLTLAEMLERAENEAKKPKDRELPDAVCAGLAQLGDRDWMSSTAAEFEKWCISLNKKSTEGRAATAVLKSIKKLVTRVKKTGGGSKAEIVRACRNRLGDDAVEWVDAAVAILGNEDLAYPPILGTGGNEGRLDYTNNFMCRVAELLLPPGESNHGLLRNALFGETTGGLGDGATGQYDPGRAGGFNQGQGIASGAATNPWNMILTMEGAIAWAGGISRRQRAGSPRLATSPFTVQPSAAGYASAALDDDQSSRAEIWTPLWQEPATYAEIRWLLREGRADIGRKQARTGLEFAQAAAGLGVDRGISEFVRYTLAKRRGDSYVALPAGRLRARRAAAANLLEDLNPLFDYMDGLRRRDRSTARMESARRELEDAMFTYLSRLEPGGGENAQELRDVVAALGRLQRVLDFECRFSLRRQWLHAANAGPEFRVACAVASIGKVDQLPPMEEHLRRSSDEFSWIGANVWQRMAATLRRRITKRGSQGSRTFAAATPVRPWSVQALIDGGLDAALLEDLIFGLVRVRFPRERAPQTSPPARTSRRPLRQPTSRSYALLAHLFLDEPIRGVMIRPEPAILSLLSGGRLAEACRIARRRLWVSRLDVVDVSFEVPGGNNEAERIAAALLVPVLWSEEFLATILRCKETESSVQQGDNAHV